nr:PREDICTED: kynurenine formamidase isoform X4 [Anolis carolinensis]|eukprot:XP_016846758.1 PREDICTED: kynurenine formamidase isoform X4 [Anolis carolinensis]
MGKWQEMSKEELETQYSPSRWSSRMTGDAIIEAHIQVTSEVTQAAQAATQTLLSVPYGLGEGEKLDIYIPKVHSETFPLVLYFHGGYWQALRPDRYDGQAGVFLVSGIYDLEPIIHTYVNDVLHMTREVALQNSPLQCVPTLGNKKTCQLLIVVAQHDSPEFRRQSLEYLEVEGTCCYLVNTVGIPLASPIGTPSSWLEFLPVGHRRERSFRCNREAFPGGLSSHTGDLEHDFQKLTR